MPKQRQTCTRCSQRRQKCDRQSPCSRCVQNGEAALCTTTWTDKPIRKYPRKPSSPSVSWQSAASSSEAAPSPLSTSPADSVAKPTPSHAIQDVPGQLSLPSDAPHPPPTAPSWPTKLPDITIEALLSDKDQPTPQNLSNRIFAPHDPRDVFRGTPTSHSFLAPAARAIQMQHVQSLLPPKSKLICIVEYYEQSSHGPNFRAKLHEAYNSSNVLDIQRLDWRWNALLFAILSSSMIGSSEAVSDRWGFTLNDKARVAREWGAAAVSCLHLGNYTTQYHIYSVQAIYVLHAYEHLLGSTTEWAALRSMAFLIAKGLGLHKLAPHPDDERILELNPEQKQAFVEREIGRRTWYTLTIQDWLCATSQPNYTSTISKAFTTARPKRLDDETMTPVHRDTPTFVDVGNYIYDFASLLFDFHELMKEAEDKDDAIRYAIILKVDGEMRVMWQEKAPRSLEPRGSGALHQPTWVRWAHKMHQGSANHKIIIIHQTFLTKSLKNVRYTYSRWACATAAKNIVNIYSTRDADEPQWWIEQAFLVTAGACLMLDLLHRSEKDDAEARDHVFYVQKAMSILQTYVTSSVALHGIRLLHSLFQEYTKQFDSSRSITVDNSNTSAIPSTTTNLPLPEPGKPARPYPFSMDPEMLMSMDEAAQFNFDIDDLGYEDLMDYLPMEGGLDHHSLFFENIYNPTNLGAW